MNCTNLTGLELGTLAFFLFFFQFLFGFILFVAYEKVQRYTQIWFGRNAIIKNSVRLDFNLIED